MINESMEFDTLHLRFFSYYFRISYSVSGGQWYTGHGTNPVARVPWVTLDEGDEAFHGCRFSPVENCEPRPIAIWPHDVFNVLPNNHPHKHYYDIIDRNDPAHRLDQRDDRSHDSEEEE